MKYLFTLIVALILSVLMLQRAEAQQVAKSDKAVFYNFIVKKNADPTKPYSVQLENVNTVRGSFKGVNPNVKPHLEPTSFLISAYDKRTGEKLMETVASNPVDINVEFDGHDGHSHGHNHGSGLQRKIISLPEGHLAVRLPFSPSECTVHVSYIEAHDKLITLATF